MCVKKEISLKTDSKTAKGIVYFQTISNKSKHIDIKYYRVGACSLVVNLIISNPRGASSNPSFLIL